MLDGPRIAALCLAAAACGGKPAPRTTPAAYNLILAGNPNLLVHPGEKHVLQVFLSQDQAGPVKGALLQLEFQDGDPSGARLDAYQVRTDESGVATVTFTAGRATDRSEVPKIVVTATALEVTPVAFTFSVVSVRRLLQIVASPVTRVAQDGLSANTSLGISTGAALRVRELDMETGTPIAGDAITFTKPATASVRSTFKDAVGNSVTATTGPGGDAQVWLNTMQSPEAFLVSASSAAGGAATAYFNVTVRQAASRCSSSQSCDPGQICVDETCQDGGGQACDDSTSCPAGWTCSGGICLPGGNACSSTDACGGGQCCDTASGTCIDPCAGHPCANGTHCQPAAACGAGTCVASSTLPDVTGVWLTRHTFDIRQGLPSAVRSVFAAFRVLDQALVGKLSIPGLPGWLQRAISQFISRLLQQFVPGWLSLLIQLGDDLATVLSSLRAEGSMRLVQGSDLAHVRGTEVWTSLVFYWLPLCDGEIGGDPAVPPACARIDVYTTDSGNPGGVAECKGQSLPSATAQVAPFTATVSGTKGAYSISVDQRTVRVKMDKVVLILVDTLIDFTTGGEYRCIEEATDCKDGNACFFDCAGLGQGIDDLTSGWVPAPAVEDLCAEVVTGTGRLATQSLAHVWPVQAELLEFNGHARVVAGDLDPGTCDSGLNCAAQIGKDDYDRRLRKDPAARDGAWTGSFFLDAVKDMPGAWEARRPE